MSAGTSTGPDRVPLVVGIGLLVIAAVVAWDASSITRTVNYGMGPQSIPLAIAGFVAILGVAHLVVAFRGGFNLEPDAIDPVAIGWILLGLVVLITSIPLGFGFIPAMTVLFACTARAFGRRAIIADLLIGFVVGTVIYLLFTKLLTLGLPQGPLERLLG
jgi:putative tricarboxylic transport membrane protein